jgi:hypothetical protein
MTAINDREAKGACRKVKHCAICGGEIGNAGHIVHGDCVTELTAALAASQRRADAAVADLKHMDNCDICKHGQTAPDGCDCECDECTLPCVCRDCRNEDKWQWRGPSDGEKGETK